MAWQKFAIYCKRGKIRWAKLSHFSQFSGVFYEYKQESIIEKTLDISASLYRLMAKATRKYFRENFDGAETINI